MKIFQMLSALTATTTTSKTQKTEALQTESNPNGSSSKVQRQNKIDQLLSKYNVEDKPSAKENINQFMERATGSEADKLATVEMTLSKGITPTTSNLMDVHVALNESMYTSEQIDMLTLPETDETVSKGTVETAKNIIANLKLPEELKDTLSALVAKGYTLKEALTAVVFVCGEKTGNISDMLKILSQNIEQVLSKLEKMTEGLKQELTQGIAVTPEKLKAALISHLFEKGQTVDVAIKISNQSPAVDQVSQEDGGMIVSEAGEPDEIKASSNPAHPLEQPAKAVLKDEAERVEDAPEQHDISYEMANEQEAFSDLIEESVTAVLAQLDAQMASLTESFELKQYLVTESTEKTIEMKTNFTVFQDDVAKMLASPEEKSTLSLKQAVSDAIEMIDKMISKQEVTLYASMKTERDLLVLSSELREATNLLDQGKTNEAIEIVSKGYNMVKALQYQPDKQKIMLFMTQKSELAVKTFTQQTESRQQKVVDMLHSLQDQQGQHHARNVVETLRFLGHNHENEVASYMDNKDKTNAQAQLQDNVKEILLKMMKEESEHKTVTSSEKSLMNLSGQQMMNDSQQNGKQQLYYFNYPIVDAEELNEMKIYISGNQHKAQMDWQNTELYFGMSLKNQGDTGIKVKVVGGQMTIKILNDAPTALKNVFETYAMQLEEIGFKNVQIETEPYQKTTPLPLVKEEVRDQQITEKTTQEGSLDFRV